MDDVKLCSTAFIRHTFTVCRFVIHTPVYPVAEIAAELLRFLPSATETLYIYIFAKCRYTHTPRAILISTWKFRSDTAAGRGLLNRHLISNG